MLDICMAIWYTSSMKKRTTIYLDDADRKAIVKIKQEYGITSDSDAIRLALRLLAEKAQEKKNTWWKGHSSIFIAVLLRSPYFLLNTK